MGHSQTTLTIFTLLPSFFYPPQSIVYEVTLTFGKPLPPNFFNVVFEWLQNRLNFERSIDKSSDSCYL